MVFYSADKIKRYIILTTKNWSYLNRNNSSVLFLFVYYILSQQLYNRIATFQNNIFIFAFKHHSLF